MKYNHLTSNRQRVGIKVSVLSLSVGGFVLALGVFGTTLKTAVSAEPGNIAPTTPIAPDVNDPTKAQPRTWCRFVPERMDDFAWENDLIAFRAYGPGIVDSHEGEDSGIDCWLKRVKYPIIDKWYAGEPKSIDYHKDHGEGNDPYHVGGSRGCGGLAIWKNGQMIRSGPYKSWKILSCEPQKSVFELNYDYNVEGDTIHEVKRISIEMGQRLCHVQSTFTKGGKPAALDIAVGITTHEGKAKTTFNLKQGWMSCWEKVEGSDLGTGVVMSPERISEMEEIRSKKADESHALIITKTDGAGQVSYSTGYGWQKAGEITTSAAWEAYLSQQAQAIGKGQ